MKKSPDLNSQWWTPVRYERIDVPGVNEWFAARANMKLLTETSETVRLRIAADTKYDLYINGEILLREGGLKRGPTPDGTYLDEVIIPDGLLRPQNTLAILLWYFGKDGFSHRDSGTPGLLVESDAAEIGPWRMRRHPAYFNAGEIQPAFRLSENSIGYSALHEMTDWVAPAFDDHDWPLAESAGAAGCAPWGTLYDRPVPQWHWSEPKEYVSVRKVKENGSEDERYFCRLPYNAQIIPIIEIEAIPGLRVTARPLMDTNCLEGIYITREGKQIHEFPGWVNGEEIVYRVPGAGIKPPKFRYRETHFGCEFSGSFYSGDDILDSVWKKAQRTLLVTMRDTFMDCPCRERAQWPGDFVIQLLQAPYCLDHRARMLVRKAADEFLSWQQGDGTLYGPVPEGNWHVELPVQMLTLLSRFGVWSIHRHSDAPDLLHDFVPRALRYLALWKDEKNGLIRYRPDERGTVAHEHNYRYEGTWDWIDWGNGIDASPVLNAWMVLALEGVELAARAIGCVVDADRLLARRERLVHAIRQEFWNPDQEAFLSPCRDDGPDDRAQALMILAGVATPEHWPAIVETLKTTELASPYMEYFVIEALFQIGQANEAITRMRRRFRSLALNTSSTLWERWPEWSEHPGTVNHSWSGGPLVLLSERVAGLQPAHPNWTSVRFAPQPGGLTRFEASVTTPSGELQIVAKQTADVWSVWITGPKGMSIDCDFSALQPNIEPFIVIGTGAMETILMGEKVSNGC